METDATAPVRRSQRLREQATAERPAVQPTPAAAAAYIERLNARMGQSETAKRKAVTLRQIAPLLSVGIVSHLGLNAKVLPPLQILYHELPAALKDRTGILGKQFSEAACALLSTLPRGHIPGTEIIKRLHDVPRYAWSGLLDAVFDDDDDEDE
ncbi:hypothetical protein H9P43_006328 [Blastocladiella emersonii ATCC 22665]|nr:hypothetical protein H9P43_006328 [Blastocladiella emersonii ATCC 22665]